MRQIEKVWLLWSQPTANPVLKKPVASQKRTNQFRVSECQSLLVNNSPFPCHSDFSENVMVEKILPAMKELTTLWTYCTPQKHQKIT